jgi:Leucine-rich repeat (LRR) protein
MAVEFKGADKISQLQSQLETLTHVSLRDAMVSSAGKPGLIASTCPLLTQIDLKSNLISDWASLSSVAEQLPHLSVLDVSHNRISMSVTPPSKFPTLGVLVLNSTNVSFAQVCFHVTLSIFV